MDFKSASRWYSALFVALVLYVAYRCTLHLMVQAKLDEIRGQGYPVTLAELDKWYPQPPPGKNAAVTYLKAFALFSSKQASDTNLPIVGDAKLPQRGEAMNEGMKQAISDYLARNGEALALLHQFTSVPQCRYPVDLTQGYGALLPHLTDVRRGVRLLLLESVFHVERSEADQAAQSILSSLALANSLAAEPTEISQQLRLAFYRFASIQLELVLNRVNLSDITLQKLNKEFSALQVADGLIRGYSGERCFNVDFSTKPAERTVALLGKLPPPDGLKPKVFLLRASGCVDIFQLRYLNAMKRFLHLCQMPLTQGIQHTKDADPPYPLVDFLICRLRLGSDGSTIQHVARMNVQVDICRASLAIEQYRLAHNNPPNKLDDLIPAYLAAIPIDSFDGQPLRYKKLPKGYVVYSVGVDGKDDGGDEKKDVTFTVER